MAPRKINKRKGIKIKSELKKEKQPFSKSPQAKRKKHLKSSENLKWLNKIPDNESYKKSVPRWLRDGPFKLKMKSSMTGSNVSQFDKEMTKEEDAEEKTEEPEESGERIEGGKMTGSETSEECKCDFSDKAKGNLKLKSSSDSVVSNYIKSGLDQVASFIVESAIRFGEQRGVVIQDKTNPNLYEFTPADKKFKAKFKKIWFKLPGKEGKKLKWTPSTDVMEARIKAKTPESTKTMWRINKSESMDKIIPILKKVKQGKEYDEEEYNGFESEMEKTASEVEDAYEKRKRKRVRKREKRQESSDSVASGSDKTYPLQRRKFRRDSIELGRKRLKSRNVSKKQERVSQES